ncbi:DUF6233 domain-containing protein [Streptomyces sp. NPDC059355]|uniref:DUF6233 domain-containing protein n=1 Tax=Streptomyces sp. NPDC059355 TaxID=3346811 RepID=UPI0036CAFBCE
MTHLSGKLVRAERGLNAAEEREALGSQRRPPAEPPARLIQRGIGAGRLPVSIHAGDCWDSRKRCTPISTGQARRALAERIPACPDFRLDTALGMPE